MYHNVGDAFAEMVGLDLGLPALSMDPSLSSSAPSSPALPTASGPVPFNLALTQNPATNPFNLSMTPNPAANPFNLSTSPGALNLAPQFMPPPPAAPGQLSLSPQFMPYPSGPGQLSLAPQFMPGAMPPMPGAAGAPAAGGGFHLPFFNPLAGAGALATGVADILQQSAAPDPNAAVQAAKKATDTEFAQTQADAALQQKLAAITPSPAAQQKLKMAAARAANVQAQRAKFYQQHPELDPSKKKSESGKSSNTLVIGVVAVALAGGGYFAWKKWRKKK